MTFVNYRHDVIANGIILWVSNGELTGKEQLVLRSWGPKYQGAGEGIEHFSKNFFRIITDRAVRFSTAKFDLKVLTSFRFVCGTVKI